MTAVADLMRGIGRAAREAALVLALAPTEQKNRALRAAAAALRSRRLEILAANDKDMAEAAARGLSNALLDRLRLDHRRAAAVGHMLAGMADSIDVIVPRGGKSLIARVREEARVPVIGRLEGVCHVYVDRAANLDMAKHIVRNAKMRRTGVCGSAETLLVDRACAATHLAPIIQTLLDAGCEVRGDAASARVEPRVKSATEQDWYTEYLDAIIAVRVVEDVDAAIAHIRQYGSQHTECIVAHDAAAAQRFPARADSPTP